MNDEAHTQEIDFIREEQARLRRQLARLEQRIDVLAAAKSPNPMLPEVPGITVAENFEAPPPLLPDLPAVEMPPPIPPLVLETPPPMPFVQPAFPPPVTIPPPVPPKRSESLEVEIGTVWLVRIGVVFLLTSLAFGGGYLYQHVIPRLGPLAKVALLYLGAGALTGVGAWLDRKKEDGAAEDGTPAKYGLRQYAQVVLAGGLAAVYYVTYAAHWNPHLRVIADPLLAGCLLLGWTGFMAFVAHRRASETLATFAILLAYYTSAINEIGNFTLFSNLGLTAAAVFLLRRHLWKVFPFASLLATYGSYGFWRYFHVYSALRGEPAAGSPLIGTSGFWVEGTFLLIYWLLFTWVIFAPGRKALSRGWESTLAGLNNGGFFGLTTWLLLAHFSENDFWKWALGFGAVLLALAEIGRRLPQPLDARTEGSYHSGGLLLITWGIIAHFNGWNLSLALAVESTALLLAAGRRSSRLFLIAAWIAGFLSALKVFGGYLVNSGAPPTWIADLGAGGLLIFDAWWSRRLSENSAPAEFKPEAWDRFRTALRPALPAFSVFGCVIWATAMNRHIHDGDWLAPSLVLAAVGLTAMAQALRIGPLAICAQGYLVIALLVWGDHLNVVASEAQQLPAWNPLVMIVGMLAIGHWWERRLWAGCLHWPRWSALSVADAVFVVIVLERWLQPSGSEGLDIWVAESAALALLLLGYGLATRYVAVAVAGQYFQIASIVAFSWLWPHSWDGRVSEPLLVLGPIVSALAILVVLDRLPPDKLPAWWGSRRAISIAYEAMVVGLAVAWGIRYFPYLEKFAFFCLTGAAIFLAGVWRKESRWLKWSAVPTVVGLTIYWGQYSFLTEAAWIHWVCIGILAAQQQFGRRKLTSGMLPFAAQAALMGCATLVGWTWVSAWVHHLSTGGIFTLAAGWSLFAVVVFAAGFLWRESTYRWLGLGILACTLGRIVFYDIWQLDSLGRILSSFALGLVLLGIAFAYIKFQKQLRNWF